ncbi:hypothetical protein BDV40DRAFT_264826 [Aspergillus tamarii]|uniref:Uncharacterized protein n=1 Tax=Aspergillus tamarii TaxID=41984 RepID=A0A5N6UVJ6_ASPTM|nr:hypothetical protein BDV40DRAFT_264826 [Aspergillus tamarii]
MRISCDTHDKLVEGNHKFSYSNLASCTLIMISAALLFLRIQSRQAYYHMDALFRLGQ